VSPLEPRGGLRDTARARLEARGPARSTPLMRSVMGFERLEPPVAERLATTLLGGDPAFERGADGRWRLARRAGNGAVRRLRDVPFVVVDVETTGGSPPRDRVVEIGAVRLRDGRIEDEWSSLVDPGRAIPWFITRLTGLRDRDVVGAPRFEELVGAFVTFLGSAPFVAHNASFDWRFVNAELLAATGSCLTNARVCTLGLARRLLPDVRRRNLDALAHVFGIEVDGRHRALGDARATAILLSRLLEVAAERGVETEADLADFTGAGGTLYPSAK